MKRKIYLFAVIAGVSLSVLCGCSGVTKQGQNESETDSSNNIQVIDGSNIYREYCKDYKKTDVSQGKEITVTAPDFEKIMQSVYEDGKPSTIDSTVLEKQIKKHPEMTKDYVFIVENDSQEQIEKGFYDMVMYDITVTAYKNIDYNIEESD